MERGRRGIAESLVFAKAKMRHYIYYFILAHELTHVSQNKNKEEYRSVSKKIMEQEAVLEESLEMYDPDPYEDYEVDGIKYRLRKNQIAKVEYMAEKKLEEWILDQEYKMDEQEYLELLIKYEEYLGRK